MGKAKAKEKAKRNGGPCWARTLSVNGCSDPCPKKRPHICEHCGGPHRGCSGECAEGLGVGPLPAAVQGRAGGDSVPPASEGMSIGTSGTRALGLCAGVGPTMGATSPGLGRPPPVSPEPFSRVRAGEGGACARAAEADIVDMVRIGNWSNAIVRRDLQAQRQSYQEGDTGTFTSTALGGPLPPSQQAGESRKARRERDDYACIGGMLSP